MGDLDYETNKKINSGFNSITTYNNACLSNFKNMQQQNDR